MMICIFHKWQYYQTSFGNGFNITQIFKKCKKCDKKVMIEDYEDGKQ